jgi:hypothetical protein
MVNEWMTTAGASSPNARSSVRSGFALAAAVQAGTAGIALLVAVLGAIALVEWSQLMDLPVHHVIALQVANVAIVTPDPLIAQYPVRVIW